MEMNIETNLEKNTTFFKIFQDLEITFFWVSGIFFNIVDIPKTSGYGWCTRCTRCNGDYNETGFLFRYPFHLHPISHLPIDRMGVKRQLFLDEYLFPHFFYTLPLPVSLLCACERCPACLRIFDPQKGFWAITNHKPFHTVTVCSEACVALEEIPEPEEIIEEN